MIDKIIAHQAAIRKERPLSPFEMFLWFFMRVSGAILMIIAVFHLLYMQFIIPGGVTAIDYSVIIARWGDPVWGFFWRIFDLLLLVFGLSHGSNGIRNIVEDYIHHNRWRTVSKTVLYLAYIVLIGMGAFVIFSFRAGG